MKMEDTAEKRHQKRYCYNLIPVYSSREYAALKERIRARRVLVSVEIDQEIGEVLDGHPRLKSLVSFEDIGDDGCKRLDGRQRMTHIGFPCQVVLSVKKGADVLRNQEATDPAGSVTLEAAYKLRLLVLEQITAALERMNKP